jgi:hypothetical protein
VATRRGPLPPQPRRPLSNGTQGQLIPSPDHLALLLPAQSLTVPIPAAARPVTLWIQGVDLTPNGLLSTDAWAVVAW